MVGSFYTSRNRLTLTTGKAAKCNRMTYNPGTQHAKHANDYMGYYAALTTISGIYQAQYFRRSNMCRTKTATLYQVRLCTVCTAVCTAVCTVLGKNCYPILTRYVYAQYVQCWTNTFTPYVPGMSMYSMHNMYSSVGQKLLPHTYQVCLCTVCTVCTCWTKTANPYIYLSLIHI